MSNVIAHNRKQAPHPRAAILLAVICVGFGGAFLYWSISQFWYSYASSSWASTQGTIYESRYVDHGRRRDGEARIRYSYSVNGRAYEGGNLLPGTLAYTDADEEEKVQQYRPGMTVPIYYDPENPESSSLEVGVVTRFPFIALAIGLPFTFYAAYLGWGLVRGQPVRV